MKGSGRTAQTDRTRRAILDGARTLLRQGGPLSVAAAAELHGISRATAYRYFSDPAMLAVEAGLDIAVQTYAEVTAGATTLRERLRCINLYFFDLALQHEAAFRSFVGMTLSAWKPDAPDRELRRGARRVAMYREALRESPDALPATLQDRLILALSPCTGTEAMIALLDVAAASPADARQAVADATDAVLDRFLNGAG